MQKARLAQTPVTVNAEYLRWRAAGNCLADFLDQRSPFEGIQ